MSHQVVECEAIACGCSDPHEDTVPVDGLPTPGPRVHLWVVVLQLKLDIQPLHTFLLLLLQSFPTNEINFLLQIRTRKLVSRVNHLYKLIVKVVIAESSLY